MACILGCIVFVDELDDRIEPAPQFSCTVAVDPGCPNLPTTDDVVEFCAGRRLVVLTTFGGTTVDMGRQTPQVFPNFLTENDDLRTAFERMRRPAIEVSRAAVPGGTEAIR